MQSSFKLVQKDVQPFVGWQVEGNGRFLLGDMTVVHNTPEGASVGLVKNLSMMASITISSNSTNVREVLEKDCGVALFTAETGQDLIHGFATKTRVVVNGDIIGVHEDPATLYKTLKDMKRSGYFNIYTAIVWNIADNEIAVCTEGGRAVRPLYTVEQRDGTNHLGVDQFRDKGTMPEWHELVSSGYIEFLDVEEGNTTLIAMKYADLHKGRKGSLHAVKYSHLEMHPSLIMGALASNIPFSDHNQAPRNCYQASQGKQALGIYASNFRHRYDTVGHIMHYPQKPLVRTTMSKILNSDNLPAGMNAIVAIATYTG